MGGDGKERMRNAGFDIFAGEAKKGKDESFEVRVVDWGTFIMLSLVTSII